MKIAAVTPGNRCSCQELVETDTAEDRCRLLFFCEFYSCQYIGAISWSFVPAKSSSAIFCVKVRKAKSWGEGRWQGFFFSSPPSVSLPPSLSFFYSTLFFFSSRSSPLRPLANGRNIVGCYIMLCSRLHTLLHVVGSCCEKFETGQTFSYVQKDVGTPSDVASVCILEQAQPRRLRWRQQDIRDIIIRMSE